MFDLQQPDAPPRVRFGAGEPVKATLVGKVKIDTGSTIITLLDVAYIPECPANLLSVPRATERGVQFAFGPKSCTISFKGNLLADAPKSANGLYELCDAVWQEGTVLAAKSAATPELWHRRLGHLSAGGIKRLLAGKAAGLELTTADGSELEAACAACEPCKLAKSHRQPYPASETTTSRPMQLVHCDIYGHVTPVSVGGAEYVLGVVDDYTGYAFVEAFKSRAEVPTLLPKLLARMERESGHKLGKLRTDGGKELAAWQIKGWLEERGATQQTTVPYTPQQSGKAERLGRSVFEKTRTLLIDANLHKAYWGEVIYTSAYLYNLTARAGAKATCYEAWHGMAPALSHLRAVGSLGYAHIPEQRRTRSETLEARAEKWPVLVWPQGSK